MSKINTGDKVIYISGKYGDNYGNPLWGGESGFIIGEILATDDYDDGDLPIHVGWEDGSANNYKEEDLELYRKRNVAKESKEIVELFDE